MRASLTVLAAGLLLSVTLLLAGCGSKGDLYLPDPETPGAPTEEEEEADEQGDGD